MYPPELKYSKLKVTLVTGQLSTQYRKYILDTIASCTSIQDPDITKQVNMSLNESLTIQSITQLLTFVFGG